jgi:hypothetical protein
MKIGVGGIADEEETASPIDVGERKLRRLGPCLLSFFFLLEVWTRGSLSVR